MVRNRLPGIVCENSVVVLVQSDTLLLDVVVLCCGCHKREKQRQIAIEKRLEVEWPFRRFPEELEPTAFFVTWQYLMIF